MIILAKTPAIYPKRIQERMPIVGFLALGDGENTGVPSLTVAYS
jgi:hypothetical protein